MIVFCHIHYGILVLLSVLVIVVLCNDALYSKCLKQFLLFIRLFLHPLGVLLGVAPDFILVRFGKQEPVE